MKKRDYYMNFENLEEYEWDVNAILNKFWGNITKMITGPEHEYVYLRGIIERVE